MLITSLTNPRVKHVVALRDKKSAREDSGLMLIEGFEELSLALACGAQPRTLFYCSEIFRKGTDVQLQQQIAATGAELVECTRPVFEKIAYRDGPDGWLAVVDRPAFGLMTFDGSHGGAPLHDGSHGGAPLHDGSHGGAPLLVVAEAMEKPGNFGAVLRTCDAAGVTGFISCDPIADLSNPNIVRASVGTLFSVPVAEASNEETLRWLRHHRIKVVATTPNPGPDGKLPLDFTQADLTQPVAILLGTEKFGLSDFWLNNADIRVRIPMLGRVNSLNVATSAALLIYEAVKQRGKTTDDRRPTTT